MSSPPASCARPMARTSTSMRRPSARRLRRRPGWRWAQRRAGPEGGPRPASLHPPPAWCGRTNRPPLPLFRGPAARPEHLRAGVQHRACGAVGSTAPRNLLMLLHAFSERMPAWTVEEALPPLPQPPLHPLQAQHQWQKHLLLASRGRQPRHQPSCRPHSPPPLRAGGPLATAPKGGPPKWHSPPRRPARAGAAWRGGGRAAGRWRGCRSKGTSSGLHCLRSQPVGSAANTRSASCASTLS
mmetsp:Transcript_138402/g.442279  ORF Transcript_138402/g.442279 Transcript_138402/m.442279 type:complete len:241 (+) Transcript_138402:1571-2293(+)